MILKLGVLMSVPCSETSARVLRQGDTVFSDRKLTCSETGSTVFLDKVYRVLRQARSGFDEERREVMRT